MELGTFIVGSICALAFIVPLVFIQINNKKKTTLLYAKLNDFAAEHNCTIHLKESCADVIIGLDKIKKVIFVMSSHNGNTEKNAVDLNQMNHSSVVKTNTEYVSNNETQSVIAKIELYFESKIKKENVAIEIFNLTKKSQLFGELQLANRWAKHATKLIQES